ncbi:DUF1249 domain-containing protein [Chiayiivirga flava]|uniref:DUF1249 domain-containing protein n=1 Tax=Chiayiivirga flava TaxID=659595 RepID=A0A7W8D2I3_9GAMM|nr:DUF1249 domain-containing protein [Chiayiivirga flava]MBB5206785.1 hypothetical protein [Chiayiivirga flava]
MTLALPATARVFRPSRFGFLMGLYAENFDRLERMFAPAGLTAARYRSSVDDGLDLSIDVLERHPYTTELRLTYALRDPLTGEPDPSAFVRHYRDARLVEVTHCYVGRRWQDVLGMHPSAATLLGHRLRMNSFLSKWLQFLADQGHSAFTLQPAALPATSVPMPA